MPVPDSTDPSPLARRWGKVAFVRFVSNCRSVSSSFVHRSIVAGCRCFAGLLTSGPHQEGTMTSEDQARSARYRGLVGAGLVAVFLTSGLLGVVLLTRDDDNLGVANATLSRPSIQAPSTSTTSGSRVEVIERLRNILRIRDEAFRARDAEILSDVYTTDCPCLGGDRNAIQELLDNNYHMVGGATSIQVRKASQVNKELWLVIADFRSAPLQIETEDNKLVREEPAGSDLFQFALARPTGSTEWLLGRATAYQDASG